MAGEIPTEEQTGDNKGADVYANLERPDEPSTYVSDKPTAESMAYAGKSKEEKIVDLQTDITREAELGTDVTMGGKVMGKLPTPEFVKAQDAARWERLRVNNVEERAQKLHEEVTSDEAAHRARIAEKQARLDDLAKEE